MSFNEIESAGGFGISLVAPTMVSLHPQADRGASALRILYVEDNDEVRESIGMLLEGEGREVIALPSSEHALATFEAQGCHVLFTDVNLPGLSGIELAKRILARDPDQWVVLCSGYQLDQTVKAMGSHVRALTKPFRIEHLDALLAEIQRDVADRLGSAR